MPHHMVIFLQHRLQFMENVQRSKSEEELVKLNEHTVQAVLLKLASCNPPLEEVNELQELIANTEVLSANAKERLIDAVGMADVGGEATGQGQTGQLSGASQEVKTFYNYLTASDWAALGNNKLDYANKIHLIACRMASLGVFWLSERSVAHVLATGIAGQGDITEHSFCAAASPEGLRLIRLLKEHVDQHKRAIVISGGPQKRIQIYPDHPEELPKDMQKSAYQTDDPPVASRVNTMIVARLAVNLPCGSSKRSVCDDRGPQQRHSPFTPGSGSTTTAGGQTILPRLSWSAPSEALSRSARARPWWRAFSSLCV